MKLHFIGKIDEILEGSVQLQDQLGYEIADNGHTVAVGKCEKGFSVCVREGQAEILYERRNDFFRALSIAVYALKHGEEKEVQQTYAFEFCGVMFDVSRRAVMKVETVKRMIRYMASMGLNQLMLYTEDTYEIEEYPYFGYLRGRYTKEEIREIVRYGNLFGIESVPCIQTLAHLERMLRWNAFDNVRDMPDTLLVGAEETEQLIDAMLKTVSECYDTKKVHIGMDEAVNTGRGKYLDLNGYRESLDILCDHLHRVVEIAKKYGLEPMMWGDMFLNRLIKYPEQKDLGERLSKKIPEGVSLVYWSYGGRSEKMYDERFCAMESLKCPTIFAGGIYTPGGPGVDYTISFESSLASLRMAKRHGVKNVIATLWGDNGTECDLSAAVFGWQYFAEFNYNNGIIQKNALEDMFRVCTGMEGESFLSLDCENYLNRACPLEVDVVEMNDQPYPVITISKQVLYQNPLLGLFDKNIETLDLRAHYQKLRKKLASVPVPNGYESLFANHAQVLKVLERKCDIGNRLKDAYERGDRVALSALVEELEWIARETEILYELRSKLWYENNKPFGFEELGNRIMAVVGMTRNAARRVNAFLSGDVDSLPELEEKRLHYEVQGDPFVIEFNMIQSVLP